MESVIGRCDRSTEHLSRSEKVYDGCSSICVEDFPSMTGQRILDVGCGTGNLGMALERRGNRCYGITISEREGEIAKRKLSDVLVADLETLEHLPFPERSFDVVVFADILEHVRVPSRILHLVKPHLKTGGRIIASIPNVANVVVRYDLLRGKFEYEPFGILDDTHVRFFTMETAQDLVTSCGYRITAMRFTNWNWQLPSLPRKVLRLFDRDWEVRQWLTIQWPNLFATQFIISASLSPNVEPGQGARET